MPLAQFLADSCARINDLGWAYYFVPETTARGEALGLDTFTFYGVGRGGVLGDVEPAVVCAAFGYFKPAVVEFLWNEGKAKISPREAAREHMAAAHDFGRATFTGLPELEAYCAAAEQVLNHAKSNAAGYPLFAGYAAEPLAEDLPARAMQLTTILREYRGCAHLVALIASGVEPTVAHFARRPEMWGMFGWSDEEIPTVTEHDIEALARADELTDELVVASFAVLDDAGRAAITKGLDAMEAAIAAKATKE
jgi:hypothetical protein